MAVQGVPPSTQYNTSGSGQRRTEQGRSFAELYQQARRASLNDNAASDNTQRATEAEENRKYIDGLRERVDTLRGEILVRVIQSARTGNDDAEKLTGDLTRLSSRLEGLRKKLQQEETRLSGKLLDLEV